MSYTRTDILYFQEINISWVFVTFRETSFAILTDLITPWKWLKLVTDGPNEISKLKDFFKLDNQISWFFIIIFGNFTFKYKLYNSNFMTGGGGGGGGGGF